MKAILVGATGATCKDLLALLLQDETVQTIVVFVRRELNIKNEKLQIHIINFDKSEHWKHLVQGDVLFSCLGTTLKAAGSKEAQWKIDYEYQYEFAKIAKQNKVNTYVLVSAANASDKSTIFYTKMKGQLETSIKALKYSRLIIFNPPILIRENSDRKMEVWGVKAINFLNKIGILRSQKPMFTKELATAMIKSVSVLKNGEHAIIGQKIIAFSKLDNPYQHL